MGLIRFKPQLADPNTTIRFDKIIEAARPHVASIVRELLPHGRRAGREWSARNPRREDRSVGSFKVNLVTGKWADFATDASGGDVISLVAYLKNTTQGQAAMNVLRMIGSI